MNHFPEFPEFDVASQRDLYPKVTEIGVMTALQVVVPETKIQNSGIELDMPGKLRVLACGPADRVASFLLPAELAKLAEDMEGLHRLFQPKLAHETWKIYQEVRKLTTVEDESKPVRRQKHRLSTATSQEDMIAAWLLIAKTNAQHILRRLFWGNRENIPFLLSFIRYADDQLETHWMMSTRSELPMPEEWNRQRVLLRGVVYSAIESSPSYPYFQLVAGEHKPTSTTLTPNDVKAIAPLLNRLRNRHFPCEVRMRAPFTTTQLPYRSEPTEGPRSSEKLMWAVPACECTTCKLTALYRRWTYGWTTYLPLGREDNGNASTEDYMTEEYMNFQDYIQAAFPPPPSGELPRAEACRMEEEIQAMLRVETIRDREEAIRQIRALRDTRQPLLAHSVIRALGDPAPPVRPQYRRVFRELRERPHLQERSYLQER